MATNSSATGRHQGMDLARKDILRTIWEAMGTDPTIVLIGEGARLKCSYDYPDILRDFPDRVHTGPIDEAAMVNMGIGAALTGLRPIVDIIFEDLVLRCMDEIQNKAAKTALLTGGKLSCPVIVKTEKTLYESPESGSDWSHLFERLPPPTDKLGGNLRVMKPATVAEHVSMMKEALRSEVPVLYIEDRTVRE